MKNKINNYDFLIVGAGLIGAIAALALFQKKFKVLVIDKDNKINYTFPKFVRYRSIASLLPINSS